MVPSGKRSADVNDFLPLRPVEFLVLAVLADGERHGYGIVQEIDARTGGKVRVAPGNLYRVLDRLMDRGLLGESEHKTVAELGDERRRYYRITDLGSGVVQAEADLLGQIAAGVRRSAQHEGSS
jgi:DNA-binding PadR family transcriptional regulator